MDRPVRLVQLQLGRVPLAGADEWCVRFGAGMLVVPLQGAAAGCRCRVPLQGAAAGCRCRVPLSERCVRRCVRSRPRTAKFDPSRFLVGQNIPASLLSVLLFPGCGRFSSRSDSNTIRASISSSFYLDGSLPLTSRLNISQFI